MIPYQSVVMREDFNDCEIKIEVGLIQADRFANANASNTFMLCATKDASIAMLPY